MGKITGVRSILGSPRLLFFVYREKGVAILMC